MVWTIEIAKARSFEIQPSKSSDFECLRILNGLISDSAVSNKLKMEMDKKHCNCDCVQLPIWASYMNVTVTISDFVLDFWLHIKLHPTASLS